MRAMWVTHGMHVCIPCRFVQSIKKNRWRKREKRKEKEKKVRKEYLTASSSEFWYSDNWSSSGLELKLATLQEVWIFSTLVNFYLSAV